MTKEQGELLSELITETLRVSKSLATARSWEMKSVAEALELLLKIEAQARVKL